MTAFCKLTSNEMKVKYSIETATAHLQGIYSGSLLQGKSLLLAWVLDERAGMSSYKSMIKSCSVLCPSLNYSVTGGTCMG